VPARSEPYPITASETSGAPPGGATARQIRGSSLLLVGRVLGLGIDFVAQVLIVRYLSKGDYGSFALAVSFVTIGTAVSLLGLERTVGRFAPIYEERGDYGRMWGTILVILSTVVSLGLLVVLGGYAFQDVLGVVVGDSLALSLLLILLVLSPLHALDSLLVAMFATFASPRSIFFRRYVVGPLLQLGVVVALIATGSDVRFLAVGFVVASGVGIAMYLVVLVRLLDRRGLVRRLRRATLQLPVREVFAFSLPLLASDLVFLLRGSVTIILLEASRSVVEVAEFRAVLPLAAQNLLVSSSFRYLFTPGASRLYARDEPRALNDLYWQSAVWIAIVTFPILAVTFAFAEPVTVLLYGERYREAGVVLAILVVGHYVHGAMGFNSLILRVFGRVRYMVVTDLATAAISLGAIILLVREFGAVGAALGMSGSLLLQNLLYQWGLRTRTAVHAYDRRYAGVYLSIAVAALALFAVAAIADPPALVGFGLAALVSLAVLVVNRDQLRIGDTFPELNRFALARRLFGGSEPSS
jgi:O-antigen/teichoic acid export membrane protein